jgi:hypothetical protein
MDDWTALAYKLGRLQIAMRDEGCELQAEAFLGESLRQLLEGPGSGFVTWDDHMRTLDMNRKVDRANEERTLRQLDRERAEYARKMTDSARVYAVAIRTRAEREISSRYRREGALIAARWLDPMAQGQENGS